MPNFYDEITSFQEIKNIVDEEQYRIDQKAAGIKTASDSQKRVIQLNQSYASRMKEYSFMIMIVAITIVTIVSILVVKDFLPEFIANLLVVLVGGIGLAWAVYIYFGIQYRDNVDFDKLYSTPPKSAMDTKGNAFTDTLNAGNISDALGLQVNTVCSGNTCCPAGYKYSSKENVCVSESESFTSLSQAYVNGEYKVSSSNTIDTKNSLTFSSYP